MAITDRLRYTVIEVNSNTILARDLVAVQSEFTANLSAPSDMKLEIAQGESTASARGINWKNWGHWIICECEMSKLILKVGICNWLSLDLWDIRKTFPG
jgi:hypothetical protein